MVDFAHVQTPAGGASNSSATSISVTMPNVVAGNMLVCSYRYSGTGHVASVSDDKGNIWHSIAESLDPLETSYVGIWYAERVVAGTTVVTFSVTGGNSNLRMIVSEYSTPGGTITVDKIAIAAQDDHGAGEDYHPVTAAVTPTTDGQLFVCAAHTSEGITYTAGADFAIATTVATSAANHRLVEEYYVQPTAASHVGDVTYTSTIAAWSIVLVTFKSTPIFVLQKVSKQSNDHDVTTDAFTTTAGSYLIALVETWDDTGTGWANGDVDDNKGNTFALVEATSVGALQVGCAIYFCSGGSRGAGHQVSVHKGAACRISVLEVSSDRILTADATTGAWSGDSVSPFDVTAAAALVGDQIAVYATGTDSNDSNAYGVPAGYSIVGEYPTGFMSAEYYKIGETGTPTVGCTKGGTIAAAKQVFATFKVTPIGVLQVGGNMTTTGESIPANFGTATTAGSLLVAILHIFISNEFADGDITDSKFNGWTFCPEASIRNGAGGEGVGVWYQLGGTRGASHQVVANVLSTGSPNPQMNLSIIEIIGHDTSAPYDTTTAATSTDGTSPFDVTAAAAIAGNQIAIYGVTESTGNDNAHGAPSGYTIIAQNHSGSQSLTSWAGYKLNETGTPTVGATKGGTISSARSVLATFKEAGGGGPTDITGTSATVASVAGTGTILAYTTVTIVNRAENSGQTSIAKPAGGQTGDFYVVGIYCENGATLSLSGFTSVGADSTAADPNGAGIVGRVNTFWRAYDGSEAAFFAPNGLGNYNHLITFIVRGADPAQTPLHNAITNNATSPYAVPGLTTNVVGSLAFIWYSGVTTDNGPPSVSGWNTEVEFDSHTGGLFSKMFALVGATGTASLTFDDNGDHTSPAHAGMIAFAPKSVGGGTTNITGTSATVLVVAGTGTITANTAVTGTPATVLVVAGTGQIGVADPDPVKIADRGARNNTGTGNMTVALTNPTAIAVGNYLVARVAVDNSGSSGARPGLTLTDTRNGTWAHGTGGLQDPGAASAGISVYLCYVKVTTQYQAGDVTTFTWGGSSPRSAVVIEEWANIDQITPLSVAETQANNVSSTAQPAISKTPLAIGELVYVCAGLEGFSSYWGAQDSDTTAGSWGDLTKAEANTGTNTTSVSVYGGYKVVTGTDAQTWNNTLGTTSDWAACAVVFKKAIPSINITGTPAIVDVIAGSGVVTGDASVAGTSTTVASYAGTGTITATTAVSGTSATVAIVAGVGQIQFPANITGTSAVVASVAGTGAVTGRASVAGTSTTVAVVAGTGSISATTAVTGTSTTVIIVAGAGSISATTAVTGTSTTVNVIAGTGVIGTVLTVSGTPAIVATFAGTGTVSATTAVTGTSATVAIAAGTGTISVNIIGTGTVVNVIAGTGMITGNTNVTGTSAVVAVIAGVGTIITGSTVVGSTGNVYVVAGTGIITAHTNTTGISATVNVIAGTGIVGVQTSITGTSTTVNVNAGTGVVTGRASVIGTSIVVTVIAGTGSITGRASVIGTSTVVTVIGGTGAITGQASISGVTAVVVVRVGIGQIANRFAPPTQGAILII